MAVLGRLLVSSAERLDLPDFLSIDSFTQGDFKYLMRSFVGGDKPYVLTGFDVINPGLAIGTQNISIRVSDSVVYYPGSEAGPFFHGLEEGNLQAAPLVPELRKNATNYVYLTLTTVEAAKDTRAFWDPDKEGGVGGEFTQDVNTQTVLTATVNVSVSSFPENTVPLCKVVVGSNFIESIQDCRDMMFRLGSGGINPNPLATYDFRDDPTSSYARTEPNTTMTNALDANAFQGGDKNIQTLKEWMDVVMTKLLELSGTTYWYEDATSFSLVNMFNDLLATSIKSKGVWQSSDVTAGLLTWTEDIVVQSVSSKRDVIIRAGSETLLNDQVLYMDQNRGDEINTGSLAVDWSNGVNYVNGALGAFENLTKGDWVKKADDDDYRYLRVEEFYAGTALSGGVTSAANALSIKLSDNYSGTSESKQGVYVQGEYLSTDVVVGNRDDAALTDAGGDLYWLALRSDKILGASDLTTTTLTIDIENHDGTRARCTSVGHGLTDGQRVTIAGSTNFDGTYQVEAETADVFYIYLSGGPHADELAQSCYYAVVTTSARSTDNGYQLESANHGLDTDQKVIISDTTNYNGTHQVFVLSDTTFSIPVPSAIANETAGTVTSVDIYVRTDLGPTKLSQGENKGIGESESENIMSFIGMDNASQTYPIYSIPPSYNTLDGYVNFNSDITDNLTQRVSKLTSMIADKAQDKTIQFIPTDADVVTNTTNSGAQEITFTSLSGGTPTMNVLMPGSANNGTLDLSGTISLNANQIAYIELDRNDGFALGAPTVSNIDDMVVDENIFIIASRLGNTQVYLWDLTVVPADESVAYKVHADTVIKQNININLLGGGDWAWNLGSNTLSWSADAYIEVPGLSDDRNTISAGNTLLSDGEVAYVDINRNAGATDTLTVSTAAITAITLPNPNRIVIARRVGDEVFVRGSKLLFAGLEKQAFQNVNLKLIAGGVWSWEATASNELVNSTNAYIQVPGLAKERNTILAQTITIPSNDEVAYVTINRDTGLADTLTVTVADETAVPEDEDIIIIARRVNDEVLVGTSSFTLKSGSFLELDGAKAEIDRYHGQLKMSPEQTISTKVEISGSDISKLDGSTLILEQEKLMLDFGGAVIDFSTGDVFESDGVTPLGVNFTPAVIGANEYLWYSVAVVPTGTNANNTSTAQIVVLPGLSSDPVADDAPRAPFNDEGISVGQVLVQENGAGGILNIDYTNIHHLSPSGSGGGGGELAVVYDKVTGQTGTTISFTKEFTYNSTSSQFFRNYTKLERVDTFSVGVGNFANEYMEVNNGNASTDITLHPNHPATADEVFEFYYWTTSFTSGVAEKTILSARVLADGTEAQGCSLSTVSSKTRVTLTDFGYNPDQNTGKTVGDLTVEYNGQAVERKTVDNGLLDGDVVYDEDLATGSYIDLYIISGGVATPLPANNISIVIHKEQLRKSDLSAIAVDIIPAADNFVDLGSVGNKFKDVNAYNVDSQTVDAEDLTVTTSFDIFTNNITSIERFRSLMHSVGDIKCSMLTEVQFQAEMDTTWVLMDGQSSVGSDYETITGNSTVPDARGMFLRGKNNGRADGKENPDGDLALGTYQADEFESHTHDNTIRGGNGADADIANNGQVHGRTGFAGNRTGVVSISAAGGNETRSKNITVNYFIKINK